MSLVRHYASTKIKKAQGDPDVQSLKEGSVVDPPFRSRECHRYVTEAKSFLRKLKADGGKLSTKASQLVEEYTGRITRLDQMWFPEVYFQPKDKDIRENFDIIKQWPDWDADGLTLTKRIPLIAHICKYGQPTDFASFRKLQVRIKKRLQFLRLKCPVISKRGQRHIEIEEFLRESQG